ncbi:MAG TPA: hypothetical protein VMZ31_14615 [Phycisphaerae bacterium]|nr:hypothetical protein [Phycisphaerae bacterium]
MTFLRAPTAVWTALVCGLVSASCAFAQQTIASSLADEPEDIRASERRIVKHFDFDERQLGNLEDVPMHWLHYQANGFPHFVKGRFDFEVGHEDPPSFVLELAGRSVAYHYYASDIPAKLASQYLIVGWVKPEHLDHARAYVSAYFLDRDGNKIAESERFSRMVGGADGGPQWRRVTVALPGRYERARFIGIQAWVAQPEVWGSGKKHELQIYRQTIHGRAWFDDITVYRLPRAELYTRAAGNAFAPASPPRILAEVGDPDGEGIEARLDVRAADGRVILSQPVPVQTLPSDEPSVVDMGDLSPGLYRASLTIESQGQELIRRVLHFACLAPLAGAWSGGATEFGVDVGRPPDAAVDAVLALTGQLGIRRVKLPVWQTATSEQVLAADPEFERLLRELVSQRMSVVATLASPPAGLAEHYGTLERSLLDVLAGPPDFWRPYLGLVVARYADVVSQWQLGKDGDSQLMWDGRLPASLTTLRSEMAKLVTNPEMVCSWSAAHRLPQDHLDAQFVCLHVPADVPPERISEQLSDFRGRINQPVWVTLAALDASQYQRLPRLVDFAKRVVLARAAGAEAVFAERPWVYRSVGSRPTVEPTEEYLVYRTLTSTLSTSLPAGTMYLGDTIRCHIFDHGSKSTLVVWSEQEQQQTCRLWLGPEARQLDLWGRVSSLKQVGSQQEVTVGPVPILLDRVDSWVARLRASVSVSPTEVPSSFKLHPFEISFTNHRSESISGRLELIGPQRWLVTPWQMRFALRPGQTYRQELTMRFPYNETAGAKVLTARLVIDADRIYELEVPTPLELRLEGIDVQTLPQFLDDRLVIRQSITNRTGQPVNFRATVTVPRRPPQRRPIAALQPGQTVSKLYVFDQPRALLGKDLHVTLEEIQGRRVFNQVLQLQ